jgi:peptidoglycan-associated lipoprotein
MRNIVWTVPLAAAILWLSGCASKPAAQEAPVEDLSAPEGTYTQGAAARGEYGAGEYGAQPWKDPSSPLSSYIIYFEYDSSEIAPQYIEVIRAHGEYLASNGGVSVLLEGHTDERGSREYNIGLGERRANAVRERLLVQGVPVAQIQTVSYGEEKPEALGHDESAWAENRRVEILYSEQ